jgi:hypothetical protein
MPDRTYEVRVTGLVPTRDLLQELGDVGIAEHELRTVLSGRFPDQAALYGFLNRLRAYGLEVVEVRRVPSTDEQSTDKQHPDDRGTDEPRTDEQGHEEVAG